LKWYVFIYAIKFRLSDGGGFGPRNDARLGLGDDVGFGQEITLDLGQKMIPDTGHEWPSRARTDLGQKMILDSIPEMMCGVGFHHFYLFHKKMTFVEDTNAIFP
jgi:hypothetical protein